MNKTNFKQYDTRWAKLGYPKSPYFIKNCGCGEVSVANCIIEMEKYAKQTPKTIQPYCVQFAAPNGNGTYFSGIPKMLEHYGMTEVKEHQTMNSLWTEMAKGNRVAILLMGSRLGGSKKIRWTSSGHFVAAVGYRKKNGKHELYIKDSNSASSSRNGWLEYTAYLQGDVSRVWSSKLIVTQPYYPTTPYTGTLPSGTVKKGSKGDDVKAVQTFLNWCMNAKLAVDGDCGTNTEAAIKKWQAQYKDKGIAVDGVFGKKSLEVAKAIVAKYEPTFVEKLMSACKTQAEWMKNYTYGWEKLPTIEKSKKKGTCVTYVACVLQRLGYLEPGKYVWHDKKGKAIGTTDRMEVLYPTGALKAIKNQLQPGDIIMTGTKSDVGSGSHIFVFTGKWDGDNPIIWDNHSAENIKKGKAGEHSYSGAKKVIAIVRLKK